MTSNSPTGTLSKGPEPKATATPETPWIGLRSFTENDSAYFFGRDQEIQELSNRIQHRQLTVLFGQSGLGKTSLLQAGVAPLLSNAGYEPLLVRLIHDPAVLETDLEQQVLRELARRFTIVDHEPATAAQSLWELFHNVRFGFVGRDANQPRPVLVIDQFEEIFTLGQTKRRSDAASFLESLACLVENRPPQDVLQRLETDDDYASQLKQSAQPCRVVLSMRSDFLHHLERNRQRMPSMMDNRMELRRLSGLQAFEAVFRPGQRRVTEHTASAPILSPETAESIVRLVAGKPPDVPLSEIENVPPLLSLICEQLNLHRLRQRKDTIENADVQCSADEVLRDFVSNCFQAYPPAIRQFVEERLISSGGFRESVNLETAVSELIIANVPNADQLLRSLIDERLLTIEDRGGVPRIELTHDILAPVIVRLRSAGAPAQALQQAVLIYDCLGDETSRERLQKVTQYLFRSLSDITASGQINSRAITIQNAALEIGADEEDVLRVARDFVAGGVLLVMNKEEALSTNTQLQVVHKSLFKQWNLLKTWIDDEVKSAAVFRQLIGAVQKNVKHLDDVSLEQAILWRDRTSPTEAWARRYHLDPNQVSILQPCLELIRNSELARLSARRRQAQLRTMLVGLCLLAIFAVYQYFNATQSRRVASEEAERNAVTSDTERVARSLSIYSQTSNANQATLLVKDVNPERLGWEWNYLQARFGPLFREVGQPQRYTGELVAVAVNSNRNLIATAYTDSPPGKQNTKTSRVSTRGSTLELLQFSGGNLRRLHAHQHPTTISALAFSQDDRLAIGDATGRVELRDLQLSPLEIIAESSDNPVSQLAFCNDDATLAVASGAPTIRSGTKTTGKSKARSSGDNQQVVESSLRLINLKDKSWSTPVAFASLTSFFISPDQRWAAVVSGESVSLLNMSTPTEPLATLPITNAQDLAFHPSGKWLAAAIGDGSIALYPIPVTAKQLLSMVSTKPLVIPSYHPQEQHSSNHQIAFDTEGKLLVSTGGRGMLAFFDVQLLARRDPTEPNTGHRTFEMIGMTPSWGNVHLAAFPLSGPQSYLLTQDDDNALRVWNWNQMVADASQIVGPESASQLAVTPDGSSIAVATDLEVKLFDVLTSRELGTFNLRDPISPSPELDERQSALVNGSKLMGFVSSQPDLLLADPQRQCVWTIGVDRSKPHALTGTRLVSLESSPTCLSVFPEAGSGQFAVGLSSGKVCVYKNKALAFTHDIGGESPIPLSLEFSRDGKLLLIGGQASMGEDTVGFLHILDMTKPRGSVNITQPIPSNPVRHLLYHPNQRSFYLAEAGQGTTRISLWDIGSNLVSIENTSFPQLSLFNECVGLCSLLPTHGNDPDQEIAAHRVRILGCNDQTIKLWNGENSREILSESPHGAPITALAASSDGRTAVSMDQDGAILVWESPSQLTSEVIRESYNKVQDELANTALLESTLTKIRFNQLIPAEVRDWQLRLLRNRLCLGNNLSAIQEDERDLLLQEVLQLVTRPNLPEATYNLALRRSQQLCNLDTTPSPKYLLSRGIAEYRLKQFDVALKTLETVAAERDLETGNLAEVYQVLTRIALGSNDISSDVARFLAEESTPVMQVASKATSQSYALPVQFYFDAIDEMLNILRPNINFTSVQLTQAGAGWTVDATLQLKNVKPELLKLDYSLWLNGNQVPTPPIPSADQLSLTWKSVAVPEAYVVTLEARATLPSGNGGTPTDQSLATAQVTKQVGRAARGKLHLMLCGNNSLSMSSGIASKLQFPEKDVLDLHQCLLQKSSGLYEKGAVVVLLGPQFSKQQFIDELRRLCDSLKTASPNDLLVVFQSGFGTTENGDVFAFHAFDRLIRWPDIEGLRALPCQVLVLLDSPHSGYAVDYETTTNKTRPTERLRVLSACRGNQICGDGAGNGIFTGLVLRGLRGEADTSADQFVTLEELVEYVQARSPASQQPQLFDGSSETLPITLTNSSPSPDIPRDSSAK